MDALGEYGDLWRDLKLLLEIVLRVSPDALHILIGFGLYVLLVLVLRSRLDRALPLVALLAVQLLNEANDLRVYGIGLVSIADAIGDLILAMFLPVLVWAVARFRPGLVSAR